jgi:hypothetical protein
VSTWNGLTELRDAQGNILIVANQLGEQESHFDTLFNNIFRTAKETRAEGVIIVMGSPALLMKLRPAQKPEDEAILN